jgi:hypothetical protein
MLPKFFATAKNFSWMVVMLGKIVVVLLVATIFYMILSGRCSSGSRQGYMPYLPSKEMCDMTPEYWPEECQEHITKREDVLRISAPLKEKCCGAGISAPKMQRRLKERCCGIA